VILPFILASMGAAQEDQGDFNAAVATYKRLLAEFPDHFLTTKAYESLARSYELSKNPDAAKEIYEKIITMFPGTIWSEKARLRYQTLAPNPFQMSAPQGQEQGKTAP
jgi:tetratricopeptide (TPR) repeat protein